LVIPIDTVGVLDDNEHDGIVVAVDEVDVDEAAEARR
jgi:hypothetical protein